MNRNTTSSFDLAIVGGGTAGLAAAIEACGRGLHVIIIEAQDRLGGTLHWAAGLMSAAATHLQKERGIQDSPDAHFADVMRISRNTANPAFVRKAVDLATDTVDWLLSNGFDIDPACPANVQNHAFYSIDRTYWGRNRALSILEVLLSRLEALGSLRPAIALRTKATSLLKTKDGAIAGVVVADAENGMTREIVARNVLVTTGGFAGNPEMFQRITGRRLYGPMPTGSDGSGIEMLVQAGGAWHKSTYLMSSIGGIEEEPGSGRVSFYERPQLIPQHRQPWEIYVECNGRRFMREDNLSIDEREQDLAKLSDTTFWIVMDANMVKKAPPLFPMWDGIKYDSFLNTHFSVKKASSLHELAVSAGIDEEGLVKTVAAYNRGVDESKDELGRKHLPARIENPPFYAIRNHAVIIKSHWGISVNTALEVLDSEGQPIPHLYACGEALGGSLLSGNSYVTGMSITPALSFGRLMGRTLN